MPHYFFPKQNLFTKTENGLCVNCRPCRFHLKDFLHGIKFRTHGKFAKSEQGWGFGCYKGRTRILRISPNPHCLYALGATLNMLQLAQNKSNTRTSVSSHLMMSLECVLARWMGCRAVVRLSTPLLKCFWFLLHLQ